jgi:hypothetical protein
MESGESQPESIIITGSFTSFLARSRIKNGDKKSIPSSSTCSINAASANRIRRRRRSEIDLMLFLWFVLLLFTVVIVKAENETTTLRPTFEYEVHDYEKVPFNPKSPTFEYEVHDYETVPFNPKIPSTNPTSNPSSTPSRNPTRNKKKKKKKTSKPTRRPTKKKKKPIRLPYPTASPVVCNFPGHAISQNCHNGCFQFAYDGVCDDGGVNSSTFWCVLGSDCCDCGPR